jgi:hypothetical protein
MLNEEPILCICVAAALTVSCTLEVILDVISAFADGATTAPVINNIARGKNLFI